MYTKRKIAIDLSPTTTCTKPVTSTDQVLETENVPVIIEHSDIDEPSVCSVPNRAVKIPDINNDCVDVSHLVNQIRANKIPLDDMEQIIQAIVQSQKAILQCYIDNHHQTSKNVSKLASDTLVEDSLNANRVVTSFLAAITGVNSVSDRPKKLYALAKAVDQICYAKDLTYFSPLSFSENLVAYSITHSKEVVTLRGIASPAGGYKTVQVWQSQLLVGDAVIAFDNDQVLNKTYRVSLDSKLDVSAVTTVSYIKPVHLESNVQNDPNLMPSCWCSPVQYGGTSDPQTVLSEFDNLDENSQQIWDTFWEKKVSKQIEYVHRSQRELEGIITDEVDGVIGEGHGSIKHAEIYNVSFHNGCGTESKIIKKMIYTSFIGRAKVHPMPHLKCLSP